MVRRIAAGAVARVAPAGCQLAVSLDGFTGGDEGARGDGSDAGASSSASAITRDDGRPGCGVAAANGTAERGIRDDDPATSRFWIHVGSPVCTRRSEASWRYRFCGTVTVETRDAGVRSVGVAVARPAYDAASGSFVVDAKGASSASFELPAGATWTGPAFSFSAP